MLKTNLKNNLKRFRIFLTLGISVVLMFVFLQQISINGVMTRGPQSALALDDNCLDLDNDGCMEGGDSWEIPEAPVAPPPADSGGSSSSSGGGGSAPVTAPAPSCGSFEFKYNECIACNQSRRVEQNSCGEYKTSDNSGTDSACASWCPAEAAPAPAAPTPAAPEQPAPAQGGGGQACTPGGWSAVSCSTCNDQGTGMNGNGSDWGTYDGQWGSWCGCAQKFSNINNYPQCGDAKSAPPVVAPPVVNTPTAPVQPNTPSCDSTPKYCPGGEIRYKNSARNCEYDACPIPVTTTVVPPTTQAACPGGSQTVCGNLEYDTCLDNLGQTNSNVCKTGASAYKCYASTNPQCNSSGDTSGAFNRSCSGCGVAAPSCTPALISSYAQCVGLESCTYNNNRAADCSTNTTGPFNCQSISGRCGFNPGRTCFVKTDLVSNGCTGQQLCSANVTTNADCSVTRSAPFNCQNSTQCGFVQQTAQGAVTITNNNNNTNNNTNTITIPSAPATITTFRDVAVSRGNVGNVGIGTSASYYYAGVKQLPKTGLPALAWIAGAFLPVGFGFKKFGKVKKAMENHPNYIWENRRFKA